MPSSSQPYLNSAQKFVNFQQFLVLWQRYCTRKNRRRFCLITASQIQLNDAFKTADDIGTFIAAEREALDEADRIFMTTSIKADKGTKMGIITDVKQALRRAHALKISYAAIEPRK